MVYVGFYGYNKLLSVSLASNARNYSNVAGVSTDVMIISECSAGYIPLLPSYNGKIIMEPQIIQVQGGETIKIVNGDSTPHTIGIVNTKVWEAIEPGDAIEIKISDLPSAQKWFLTCDGINLGDKAPAISLPGI